jgi:diadenosine tetraphosphate (Ap4A) HIT family hydrolase
MTCPFCSSNYEPICENELCYAIRDGYPVSPGHTLIITKKHVGSFIELSRDERIALMDLLEEVRMNLAAKFSPDGFNIGINDESAAGQTVMHLHMHVIPRYSGDVLDPRGGIRWIFPEMADYWSKGES